MSAFDHRPGRSAGVRLAVCLVLLGQLFPGVACASGEVAAPAAESPTPQTQTRPAGTQSQPAPSQTRPSGPPSASTGVVAEEEGGETWFIQGDPVIELLPRDAIASLDQPLMVPAAEADGFMRDEEMVLGVFDGQQARAYSTWHLDRHEIVNDQLGDTPIAATW